MWCFIFSTVSKGDRGGCIGRSMLSIVSVEKDSSDGKSPGDNYPWSQVQGTLLSFLLHFFLIVKKCGPHQNTLQRPTHNLFLIPSETK